MVEMAAKATKNRQNLEQKRKIDDRDNGYMGQNRKCDTRFLAILLQIGLLREPGTGDQIISTFLFDTDLFFYLDPMPKNKSPPIVSPIHTRTRDGNRFCFGRFSRESRDKTRNIVHEFLCLLLPLDYFVQSRVLASEGGNFQFLTKRNEEIFYQIRIVREPSCPKKWNF